MRAAERAADGQPACLLRVEDRAGPLLHPGHHLDRRQHDEREPVAGATGDERLEQVVGEGREQEQSPSAMKATSDPPGRDQPEGQALTGDRERPERDELVVRAREEQRVDDDDRGEQDGRDAQRPKERAGRARVDQATAASDRAARTGRTTGGSRNAASRTSASRQQLRDRVAPMQPARSRPGSSRWSVDIARSRSSRSGLQAATVASPRLNIVRTVSGRATRMRKTTVYEIVLSSGSLVSPWANADWKMFSPSVRNSATSASVPPPVTPPNTPAAIGAEIAAATRPVVRPPIQTGKNRALSPRRAQYQAPAPTRSATISHADQPGRIGERQAGQVRPAEEVVRRPVGLHAGHRREVAARAEQQAQDREDEGERRRPPSRR